MITPPATCDSQHILLTTMPQSCTATNRVQRTTPVSVSAWTSATCTPPTLTFDSPGDHRPWADAVSMPSRAQASFQVLFLFLPLSTMWPGSMARSSFLASSRGASFSNKASRPALAELNAEGAWLGQVVLPPEPLVLPHWLSPTRTVMSFGS